MMLSISIAPGSAAPFGKISVPAGDDDYVATLTEFSRDMTIFDSGAHRGQSAASVFISGGSDAPDGQVIEWRAVDVENAGAQTTGWSDAVTISTGNGSWGAFVSLPRTVAWMRIEARVKGSPASAVQMTTRCAAGHVWAIWEQSNWARLDDYNSALAFLVEPVARPDDVQIARRAPEGLPRMPVPSRGSMTRRSSPPSMVSLANAFSAARPGEKAMIGWHTYSGTSTMTP